MTKQDGFGHETPYQGETNDWITPQWVIKAFDSQKTEGMYFDLDPCVSMTQPWLTARKGYSKLQDGLAHEWFGTVYLNPPYGASVGVWAEKMMKHGDGIMLIFARTETKVWQDFIFPSADGFLFPKRRISFCRPDGTQGASSGAPSAFVAWGAGNKNTLLRLCESGVIEGAFLPKAVCTSQSKVIQTPFFKAVLA